MPPEPKAPVAPVRRAHADPWWVRWTLTTLAVLVLTVLVIVPVVNVFYQALAPGFWDSWADSEGRAWPARVAGATGDSLRSYWSYLVDDPYTRHAVLLTLTVAPAAVLANLVFGVAAAWAIARFRFPGRTLLLTLIDLPFSVSPVVAGLVFVLVFGKYGYFGPWLLEHNIKVIFATPGLILVTAFVTFPFVARELIPLLEATGPEEELAALSLGASGWQMFWRVTLPNIHWGVLYGLILCSARALGEYGAVYVVSGHVAGETDTMPLRVGKLLEEYNTPGSFAVASVLTGLALVTLALKVAVEHRARRALREGANSGTQGPVS